MEGLRSGYPFGKMEKTELEKRFSLSYAYCLKNLKKNL